MSALLPLLLIYYFSVGGRHPLLWHLAFLSGIAGGVGVNSFWLWDWLTYWWIRAPLHAETPLLPHRTFAMFWAAPIWGEEADRVVAEFVCGAAVCGVWLLNRARQRPAARLLGFGAAGFLLLAAAGLAWEPLARLGTARLFVPALWLATMPAAHGMAQAAALLCRLTGSVWRGVVLTTVLLGAMGFAGQDTVLVITQRCAGTRPLAIGLAPADKALVEAITQHTTSAARILWEDCCDTSTASHWSALLPILTDRAYLGGLDANACIEHAYPAFVELKLARRPISNWRDEELADFCRHYNAGWAVCRSPAAKARFRSWLGRDPLATIAGSPPAFLYELRPRSYVLKGHARLVSADSRHIALADVDPVDGKVVLSLHYQPGLRASPSRVQIEKEPDPYDPVPFIRLRMPGPVARVTLTWRPP